MSDWIACKRCNCFIVRPLEWECTDEKAEIERLRTKVDDLEYALTAQGRVIREECARKVFEHRPDRYSLYDRTDFATAIRSLKEDV